MSLLLRYLLVAGPSLLLLALFVALTVRRARRRRRHREALRQREIRRAGMAASHEGAPSVDEGDPIG